MAAELATRILVMAPLMYLAFVIYVYFLLLIARKLDGPLKGVVTSLLYGVFGVAVVFPLVYLINTYHPQLSQGDNILLFSVLVGYFFVIAPGFYYLFRQMGPLRNAGYFKAGS